MVEGAGFAPANRLCESKPMAAVRCRTRNASGRAFVFKLPLRNGQKDGLRSRDTVLPEHGSAWLSYFLNKMVAAAGFDTRKLQVLNNQCPGGPLPDKWAELEKGVTPPAASAWATLRIIFINSG